MKHSFKFSCLAGMMLFIALFLCSCGKPSNKSLLAMEKGLQAEIENDLSSFSIEGDVSGYSFPNSKATYFITEAGVEAQTCCKNVKNGIIQADKSVYVGNEIVDECPYGRFPVLVYRRLEVISIERNVTSITFQKIQKRKRGDYTYYALFNAKVTERVRVLTNEKGSLCGYPIGHFTPEEWAGGMQKTEKQKLLQKWENNLPEIEDDVAFLVGFNTQNADGSFVSDWSEMSNLIGFAPKWTFEEHTEDLLNEKVVYNSKTKKWEWDKQRSNPVNLKVIQMEELKSPAFADNPKSIYQDKIFSNGIFWEKVPGVEESLKSIRDNKIWWLEQWQDATQVHSYNSIVENIAMLGNPPEGLQFNPSESLEKSVKCLKQLSDYMTSCEKTDSIIGFEAEKTKELKRIIQRAMRFQSKTDGGYLFIQWLLEKKLDEKDSVFLSEELIREFLEEVFQALPHHTQDDKSEEVLSSVARLLEEMDREKLMEKASLISSSLSSFLEDKSLDYLEKEFQALPHRNMDNQSEGKLLTSGILLLKKLAKEEILGKASRLSPKIGESLERLCLEYLSEVTSVLMTGDNLRTMIYWKEGIEKTISSNKAKAYVEQIETSISTSKRKNEWKSPLSLPEVVRLVNEIKDNQKVLPKKLQFIMAVSQLVKEAAYKGWIEIKEIDTIMENIVSAGLSLSPTASLVQWDENLLNENSEYLKIKKKKDDKLNKYKEQVEELFPLYTPGSRIPCRINGVPQAAEFVSYNEKTQILVVRKYGKQYNLSFPKGDIEARPVNMVEKLNKTARDNYIDVKMLEENEEYNTSLAKLTMEEFEKIYQTNIAHGWLNAECSPEGKITLVSDPLDEKNNRLNLKALANTPESWIAPNDLTKQISNFISKSLEMQFEDEKQKWSF